MRGSLSAVSPPTPAPSRMTEGHNRMYAPPLRHGESWCPSRAKHRTASAKASSRFARSASAPVEGFASRAPRFADHYTKYYMRSELNAALSSDENSSGSSQAAKG